MNSRIKDVRTRHNMSQQEFADALNLTKNFISLVETGNREASDRTVRSICDKFGVSETWLRTGHGKMETECARAEAFVRVIENCDDIPNEIRMRLGTALAQFPDSKLEVLADLIINLADALTK